MERGETITQLPPWEGKYTNTNPLEKLHEGEPWFFIRAQDITAPGGVDAYANTLNAMSEVVRQQGHDELANQLHSQSLDCFTAAEAIRLWQKQNPDKVKLPD